MRVLVVEDDVIIARVVSLALASTNAAVDQTDTGQEAIELAKRYDYDIIILDLMLPDIEGYEVVRRLRDSRIETPILILSGLSRPPARVRGLSMGADDFLCKPFDQAELLARIHALVRRSRGFARPEIFIGNLRIDLQNKLATVDGRQVPATGKEYQILELLALRKGMTITKEAFLSHLYGGIDEPEIKIIDVFICKLRKKLAKAGADDLIGTAWGRGYVIREPQRGRDHHADMPMTLQGAVDESVVAA